MQSRWICRKRDAVIFPGLLGKALSLQRTVFEENRFRNTSWKLQLQSTQRLGTSNSKERDTFLLHRLCRQSPRVVRSFLAFWAWSVLVLSRKWISKDKDIKKQASSNNLSDPILRECMTSLSYWKKTQKQMETEKWESERLTDFLWSFRPPICNWLQSQRQIIDDLACRNSSNIDHWMLDLATYKTQAQCKSHANWLWTIEPKRKKLHSRNVKTFAEAQHSPVRSPRAAQPPLEEHAAELEGSKGNGAVAPPNATSWKTRTEQKNTYKMYLKNV